jgi:hypothetical protein
MRLIIEPTIKQFTILSSLYVCMAIKHIIGLFLETPRKFITAVINLRGISTNKTIISSLFYFKVHYQKILLTK